MKKFLLFAIAITFVAEVSAQSIMPTPRGMKKPNRTTNIVPSTQNPSNIISNEKPEKRTEIINGRLATYIPLGQSPNILSFVGNPRTYLWADPSLNSLVFTHSMATFGDTLNVGYDVSYDGGNTWSTNNSINVEGYSGNISQGGIINPEGNIDPNNAFYTFFSQVHDGTTGTLGDDMFGSNKLTNTELPDFNIGLLSSDSTFMRDMSDAFTITQQGVAWYAGSINEYVSGEPTYNGQLVIGKAEIIDGVMQYEEQLISFLTPNDHFNDIKIAFSPNGLTGYICVMSSSQGDPVPYTNYHPILIKTTDGGNTWSDPIHVQFGGVDGIESVKYYWSDEIITSIDYYGSGFNRDEVYYNLGYHCDLIVDGYGNPHITGIITLATDEGWFPSEGTMATWHIYSNNGGSIWAGTALYDNIFFEGDLGGVTMYNRPNVASSLDGEAVFFSWLDTDLDGAEGNTNPNIFVVGYCPSLHIYTDVDNVTELSLHWFSAFYGSMTHYVFCEEYYNCELPFVFSEFSIPGDPFSAVVYWYIDGYTLDRPVCSIGFEDVNEILTKFSVAQNSPNPAFDITSILVTTKTRGEISLEIHNTLGQVVHHESVNNNALAHTFYVDVSNFDPGLYVYTIRIGNNSSSNKMLVK